MPQAYPHETGVNIPEELSEQIQTNLDLEIVLGYASKYIANIDTKEFDKPYPELYDKAFKGVSDALNAVAAVRALIHEHETEDKI